MSNLTEHPDRRGKTTRIEELQQLLKRARTTLKSLKTRQRNQQERLVQRQQEMYVQMMQPLEHAYEVFTDLVHYAKLLKDAPFLGPGDRAALLDVQRMFADLPYFGPQLEEHMQRKQQAERGEFDFDEDARARAHDLFQEFRVEPPKQEQREIRKVFLDLSTQFHPDKARTDAQREQYHALMQDINAAYQANDIDRLLEIELLNAQTSVELPSDLDELDRHIERLERDLDFTKNQIERTSQEIKNFRKSDLGKGLTELDRMNRQGEDLAEDAENIQQMTELMTQMRDALKDTYEQQRVSPLLYDLLANAGPEDADDLNDIDEDFFSMFLDDEDDDDIENLDDPKFPEGTQVKVTAPMAAPAYPDFTFEGLKGVVHDAYLRNGVETYEVLFSHSAMKAMPPAYIEATLAAGADFQVMEFAPDQLKRIKYKAKSAKATEKLFQELRNRALYGHLSETTQEIIRTVLSSKKGNSPQNGWLYYFEKHLPLPLAVVSRGLTNDLRKGTRVEIQQPVGGHPMFGIIVGCTRRGKRDVFPHPLFDLRVPMTPQTQRAAEILDAYYAWMAEE